MSAGRTLSAYSNVPLVSSGIESELPGQRFPFAGLLLILLNLAANLLLMPVVEAQTSSSATTTFDVSGVRIGMTKEQAIAALKAFDPNVVITDFEKAATSANSMDRFGGSIWDPPEALIAVTPDLDSYVKAWDEGQKRSDVCSDQSINDVRELSSKKGKEREDIIAKYPKCKADAARYFQDRKSILDTPRTTVVWLSLTPGQQKVIAVSSSTSFVKSETTTDATKAALFAKYNQPVYAEEIGAPGTYWWKLDPRGRLKSKADAEKSGFNKPSPLVDSDINFCRPVIAGVTDNPNEIVCPHAILPRRFSEADGIILLGSIRTNPQNRLLVREVSVALFDSTAIFAFRDGSRAASQNSQTQQKQDEAAKVKGPAPRF